MSMVKAIIAGVPTVIVGVILAQIIIAKVPPVRKLTV